MKHFLSSKDDLHLSEQLKPYNLNLNQMSGTQIYCRRYLPLKVHIELYKNVIVR